MGSLMRSMSIESNPILGCFEWTRGASQKMYEKITESANFHALGKRRSLLSERGSAGWESQDLRATALERVLHTSSNLGGYHPFSLGCQI